MHSLAEDPDECELSRENKGMCLAKLITKKTLRTGFKKFRLSVRAPAACAQQKFPHNVVSRDFEFSSKLSELSAYVQANNLNRYC